MIKTPEYYLRLDLDKIKSLIPTNKDQRLTSEVYSDIINAIYFKSKSEDIDSIMLENILGEPGSKVKHEGFEVWEYEWIGTHDGNEFKSKTPFKIVEGKVIGVEKNA